MDDSTRLQDQIIVITGSTRGIGLVMAKAMVTAGAKVVICGRSQASLDNLKTHFDPWPSDQILPIVCDVTDLQQVENLADQTLAQFGKIDTWFNNAAVNRYFGPALEVPLEHWREVIDTNLNGTYYGTIVALKRMLPRNQGKIINLFGAGTKDTPGNSYLSAYVTSKAAVRRLTLTIAQDYRHTPISILGFNPGLFDSDLTRKIQPVNEEAKKRMKILDFGLTWLSSTPEAVGTMAVYLASEATQGQTGRVYRCFPAIVDNIKQQWSK
jgi:NAD(P)-dependent dehydrogenase (short-subunit alcohol dehydrogenase family)